MRSLANFALIAALFAATLFAAWKWDTTKTNEAVLQTDETLVRDITAQLPAGTPRADIEKFLAAHGTVTPGYFNYGGPMANLEGATAILFTRTTPVGNEVHSCSVVLYFRLDGSDGLMGYTHEPQCTSFLLKGNQDQGTPLLR